MIELNRVYFEYPNQPVFNNLNLFIESEEFVFLLGKSGSGKTTLMQMLYMNLLPSSGYVKVGEYSSQNAKSKDLPFLRRQIGIVFQDFKLFKDKTIYDNLAFVLEVTGKPHKEIKEKVFAVLAEVGLSHKSNNYPTELSGGEKQRIAIARAIINDPVVLIADEPTGNLDPETTMEILEILKKINQRGTTVILATHNYSILNNVDARIVKLDKGKALEVRLEP